MPKVYLNLDSAIRGSKEKLMLLGQEVQQEKWQSVASPSNTWEVMDVSFKAPLPAISTSLVPQTKPNLPWADEHFDERVSGIPMNPGKSYKNWPHFKHVGEEFKPKGVFSHTYMERFWPKEANCSEPSSNSGIRYSYGDLRSVVELLVRDPSTRQAYIPIWFPEDTGVEHRDRVPCTIGYWLVRRYGFLHMTYYIRSCDIIRHFRDDIYLASKLLYWMLGECRKKDNKNWSEVAPGNLTMHIGSLHCFINEVGLLKLDKT